ncbi:hypothetical protein L0F63_000113 [Massospora cicadina]|nr:hypothetical protein L0F63_000113 [Massospora cicadina]
MPNQEPYVFDIDIRALQHSSNRPFHLEQRMQFRKLQARLTVKAAELNRNAFLEERRKKLAKRYLTGRQLHDQHCQRAQIQKKLKRTQLSRLLESADAKRRLLISNQTKNCSLAVKRAKEVARLHNLRIEKERECRRVELELRINHSSQRRNQILRTTRRKFAPSSEQLSLTPLEATIIIQSWWRNLKFLPLINSFKRYELTFEVSRGPEASLSLFKACLTNFGVLPKRCSLLLSRGYRFRTGKMLYNDLHQFLALWDEYYYNFEAWKSLDIRELVESMTQHFIELDLIWEKFRGGKDSEQDWREEILRQREEIKEQVRNIAGEGAVAELINKHRLAKQASSEPLSSPTTGFVEPMSPRFSSDISSDQSSSAVDLSSLLLEQKIEEAFMLPSFPLEAVQGQSVKFSARELAHEIIMNPNFKLSSESNTTFQKVRKVATQAFFDNFKEKENAGDADSLLLDLLNEVRLCVIKLLPSSSHFYTKFISEFDMDILRQQIEQKTFDFKEWVSYISTTLKLMCAPVRDDMVRKIVTIPDPFETLQFIFEVLDLMLIDHLNHQIASVRPTLLNHAVEYEATKFNQLLEKGEVKLTRTSSWLMASIREARNLLDSRNPENTPSRSWPNFEALIFDAFLSIIFSNTPIGPEECPETLELDAKRLFDLQNEVQLITIVAALFMICKNVASEQLRYDLQTQAELKNNLIAILRDGTTTLEDLSSYLVSQLSSGAHKLSSEQQIFLTNMVRKTVSYRDSLYLVLSRRLQRILRQLLISGEEKAAINSNSLTSHGLGIVADEVASVGSRLARLVHYNRRVYASHYNFILSKATAAFTD